MSFTGKVVDEFGEPLIGVHIVTMFRPQNIGVTSDFDGNFHITDARSEESWKLSHLGYEDVFFKIPRGAGNQTFTMIQKAIELDGFTGTPTTNQKEIKSNLNIGMVIGVIAFGLFIASMKTSD